MYLSRLILNPRSRQVRAELARPYQMHKTLLRAFPEKLPSDERVLFRLEEHPRSGMLMLLVQSQHQPDWSYLRNNQPAPYLLPGGQLPTHIAENPSVKPVDLRLQAGQRLAFRLFANPTVKRQGKRHGLYREEEQLKWLKRKLEAGGANLLAVRTSATGNVTGKQSRRGERNQITLFGVRFEGVLQVVDPDRLLQAVHTGIGSGKGFGFGLLSLAPAR